MDFKAIDIKIVEEVADGLKDLLQDFVFVGGAVITFYIDDPAADELRTTNDIDMTIQLTNYSQWTYLQDKLLKLGFSPNPMGHAICSYLYQGVMVDIMPSEDGILGKSNKWYKPGFRYLKEVLVGNLTIKILQLPYFLATKFEAFNNRGKDYRTSHDFEDIIYIFDNCTTTDTEILAADDIVKGYLKSKLLKIMSNPYFEEIISSHLHPYMVEKRLPIILEKIKKILP